MESMLWLFPIIFMIHEMEEIIGFRIWLDKNIEIVNKYKVISILSKNFSNEAFALAVLQEYLLCILITATSIFFNLYIIWLGAFIAFTLHLFIHIVQSIVIKKYIPALATSIILLPISLFLIIKVRYYSAYSPISIIISSLIFFILMILNLIFLHYLMGKITKKIQKIRNKN